MRRSLELFRLSRFTTIGVSLLMSFSCVREVPDKDSARLFINAAAAGEEAIVQELLSDHRVGLADSDLTAALIVASEKCYPGIVKLLLDAGADVHSTDDVGQQVLTKAAMFGCEEAALRLLDAGADPEGGNTDKATPIMWAATRGDPELIRTLVEFGANIDADAAGFTPLMFAIENQHEEAFETLIELGADPDRMQPLLYASAKEGGARFVRGLLDAGANPDTVDIDGVTPLMAAADSGNVDVVRLLLDAGADPLAKSKDGRSALDMAKESGASKEEIVSLLSEHM